VFRTLGSRKLSKLEIYASVPGLQKFTWVVYQKRANSSVYDLVYQVVTAQTAATQDWVSSPALDFTFAAAKSYAVGVHITGTARVAFAYVGAIPVYARAGFITAASASQVSDAAQQPSASVTPSSSTYQPYLRFTTTLAP